MTVINIVPESDKTRHNEYLTRKDPERTNLDWAKWTKSWIETDAMFTNQWNKGRKCLSIICRFKTIG
jgi:hypothetical protein